MLAKNYIRASIFDYTSLVLIIKKSDENLRVCVNYKALNALIIKNRNSFSLIKKILARLCAVKFYIKLDVIVTFNKIRIASGDEKKTAFLIRYRLFEYVVMPFELCNAPETFQLYINETFKEYLNDFVSAYLNDVFIYSNIKEKHTAHIRKVLNKLKKTGLFLDIDKCEFYVIEVKYFELIIIIEGVKMNPEKVKAILKWPILKNLKNVQTFLNFVNFYKKFIAEYFKLIQSFIAITKANKKNFIFS